MKKLRINNCWSWLSPLFLTVTILGCQTTLDTYQDFVKDGETVYIGTADTVFVAPGFNKLRFYVAINSDPKISRGLLKTNDGSVNHEFEVTRTKNGKDTVAFDLELPEGEYNFGLFMMDKAGNSSVRREVPARVYGETYRNNLINRSLDNIDTYLEGAIFYWDEPLANMQKTILTYEDEEGVLQTVTVLNEESETHVDSYKLGGQIMIKSLYKPLEIAMEDFEAIPLEDQFPIDYILDKRLIQALRLPGDASDGCYESSYERLTDGSIAEYWHSCDTAEDQYPFIMSFDLGVQANLSRFKLDERQDCCGGRSPGAYQIWATNNPGLGETINIDEAGLEAWEADAVAKGWVKLVDQSGNQNGTFTVDVPSGGKTYQYLRFVGISAIDGSPITNFNEFTFWGK
jgi:hypothetical protein